MTRPWAKTAGAIALFAAAIGCSGTARNEVVAVTAASPASTGPSPGAVELRFRPVLQILPPEETAPVSAASGTTALATTKADEDRADQTVVLPELDGAGAVVRRYQLGPAFLGRSAIEHADAVFQNGWQVALQLKPGADGIDTWNKVCEECFNGAASCPGIGGSGHGLIAIVVDSVVKSAPEIQPTDATFTPFQGDQISISGDFTETEANQLAAGLRP